MNQEVGEKRFSVSGQARLVLKNISGDIHLEPGEPGSIHIKAIKRLDRGDPDNTQVEISQDEQGCVWATTRFPPQNRLAFLNPFGQPSPVTYTVHLPAACWVDAQGVSGNLYAVGLEGELDLRTVSGAVRAGRLSGRMLLSSVSGSVTGDDLAGDIEAQTVSGRIQLAGLKISSCRAHSTSGDICLASPLEKGPYQFKTISGQVRLELPAGALIYLKAHSFSGKIHLAPQIQTGAAGIPVKVDSLSGHIWIQAGEYAPVPSS